MKKTFQKALENLQDRPAEFTIIALMLFLAVLTVSVIGEEWKFWALALSIITVSVTLIIIVRSNKPVSSKVTNESKLPNKLLSIIDDMQNISLYHKKVEYQLTLVKKENEKLWIRLKIIHITKNSSNVVHERPYNYYLRGKNAENTHAEVNDEKYDFRGSVKSRDNGGYHIFTSILPNDEVKVMFSSLIEYNLNDLEVLLTYKYCERFIFSFCNEVDELTDPEKFAIFFETIHPYKNIETKPKYINNNEVKIEIDKGLLPYQGIYLNWRIL